MTKELKKTNNLFYDYM